MKRGNRRQAKKQRRRNSGISKKRFTPPKTLEGFFSLPEQIQDIYVRVTHAISKMKTEKAPLPKAAAEYGVTRRQMLRYGRAALRKLKNGRYAAKAVERLLRVLVIPTLTGLQEIGIIDSRQATLLAEYWNAVHRYLKTGDRSELIAFQDKHVTDVDGATFPLLTSSEELDRLASAGVLSFESLYARAG